MVYDDFLNLIDIKEEQIDCARYFLDHRGIEENILVVKFLEEFIKDRRVRYEEIATAFRYDKRIRRVLYKYIGYIEETVRAYISNKYEKLSDLPEESRNLIKNQSLDSSTYSILSNKLFSECMEIALCLPSVDKNAVFSGVRKHLKNKAWGIVTLRNQIGHNKFLLNSKLDSVYYNNKKKDKSLLSNIKNLSHFLPNEIKNGLIRDIKNCAIEPKENKYPNQVAWILCKDIIIKL